MQISRSVPRGTRYFVTPVGLTIVTRDASLFENPVDPDFLQRY